MRITIKSCKLWFSIGGWPCVKRIFDDNEEQIEAICPSKLLDIERLVKVNDFNFDFRYNIEFTFNTTSIFLGITLIQSDSNTKIYAI